MAHSSQAEDHPAILVEVHTVVLVSVQVFEDEVHGPLVVLLLHMTEMFATFPHERVVCKGSVLWTNSSTHHQQLSKFILEKLLQLCFAQRVGVPFSASIFTEGFDEEGHGLTDVRHPGSCFQMAQIQNQAIPIMRNVFFFSFPFCSSCVIILNHF